MNEINEEISNSEIENNFTEVSNETSEIDSDFANELDDVYKSHLDNSENLEFESKFDSDVLSKKTDIETEESDSLISDVDSKYDAYMDGKNLHSFEKQYNTSNDIQLDNKDKNEYNIECSNLSEKNDIESLKCRNENLEGQVHPETGVPFERCLVEVDGNPCEVVIPRFESTYDARLPEDMYGVTDYRQFKECDQQLKKEVESNVTLKEQFDDEQLEQIENGDTPSGYTWHHDAETGKMQLVDTEIHQKTAHTGGRSIWGGGTESR